MRGLFRDKTKAELMIDFFTSTIMVILVTQ